MDTCDIVWIIQKVSKCDFENRGVLSDYEEYIPARFRDDVLNTFKLYYRIRYGGDGLTVERDDLVRLRKLRNEMFKSLGI